MTEEIRYATVVARGIEEHEDQIIADKRARFHLSDSFVEKYKGVRPNWGPIGEFVYLRTYSRWITEESGRRKEQWFETVRRVVEGVFNVQKKWCFDHKIFWDKARAQKSAKRMFEKMFEFKFLPAGRGLWGMGTQALELKGAALLNNCAFTSTEGVLTGDTSSFEFLMDMSMLGVGVGFDVKGAGHRKISQPNFSGKTVYIEDTREAWVASLKIVMEGFLNGGEIPKFDYSLIRPKGAAIFTFGGEASGPDPLIELHEKLIERLSRKIGETITSGDIVDTMNMIGKCVVSGNVRRSSEIALGSFEDEEFMNLKNFELYPDECNWQTGWRWASNNSVFAEVGQDYDKIGERIATNGEPGLFWLQNTRDYGRMIDAPNFLDYRVMGTNPCGEQSLEDKELCLLVETFPSRHENYEEYKETLKYAYLYAKTVSLIPTHREDTNAVIARNRRIGCSQSGITDAFAKHGRHNMIKWCDEGYSYLRQLDGIYSDWFGVARSVKITSIKPSGTVSLLPGVAPGIHYPWSKFYNRRVRVAQNSPLVEVMKNAGYTIDMIPADKSAAINFPVKVENFTKSEAEVSMWEQMLNLVDYQSYWADNQVSVTIKFDPKTEAADIPNALSIFDRKLKSVSFLPKVEGVYQFPAYEEITEEVYNEMASALTIPDYTSFTVDAEAEKFCDGDSCTIK